MKVIIAEKPSVAREIARVIRATNKKEGYIEGGGYAVCCPCYSCVPPGRPDSHVDGSFLKVLVVTAVEHFHEKSIFAGRDVGVYGMMMVGGQAPFLVKSFQIPAIHIFGSIQVTQVQKAKREGMLVVVKGDMAAAVDSGMKRSFYIRRVCRPVE